MVENRELVRCLHISDLHASLSSSYDSDRVTNALVDSLPKIVERNGTIDLVFFTGDVAKTGKHAEYEAASKFFDKLLITLGLERKALFVVPGNHDVDRGASAGLGRTLSSLREADELFDGRDIPQISVRQNAFKVWYDEYFGGLRIFPTHTTVSNYEIDTIIGSLEITCLNTAAFSCDDHDHGKLFLGHRSLKSCLSASQDTERAARLALMHHPIHWLSEVEASSVKAFLRERFDLICSGHLHEIDFENIVGVTGSSIHLVDNA